MLESVVVVLTHAYANGAEDRLDSGSTTTATAYVGEKQQLTGIVGAAVTGAAVVGDVL